MKKIGFVIPWFAEKISGGAESALRDITHNLKNKGIDLEILTTCVQQFSSDWNVDYYKEGIEVIQGIDVRRFKIRKRDIDSFDKVNVKFMNKNTVTIDEEDIFLKEMVNSPDLYTYIEQHSEEYDLFVFIPYMFGTTYFGIEACTEKAVMIPCLHDESYAYMKRFQELYPKIRGMVFLSEPESKLAHKLYDISTVESEVIGTGLDIDVTYSAERFRNKYNIHNQFILYAGRKDSGKNLNMLIRFLDQYKKETNSQVKLILIGGGKIEIPTHLKDEVIDFGYVSIEDKYDAYAAATFMCQPSRFESFSIVIMESWLCKRPVLVFKECEVTTNFAKVSNGGLYFSDYYEFRGTVDYLLHNEDKCKEMGEAGYKFVINNYSWEVVTDKYINFFNKLINSTKQVHINKNIVSETLEKKYIVLNCEKLNQNEMHNTILVFQNLKERIKDVFLVYFNKSLTVYKEDTNIINLGFITNEEKEAIITKAVAVWLSYTENYSDMDVLKLLKLKARLVVNEKNKYAVNLCKKENVGFYYNSFMELVGIIKYILNKDNIAVLDKMKSNSVQTVGNVEKNMLGKAIENLSIVYDHAVMALDDEQIVNSMEKRRQQIQEQMLDDKEFKVTHDDCSKHPVQIICYDPIQKENRQSDIMLMYHYYHTFINSSSELILCGKYNERNSYYRMLKEQINELAIENVIFAQNKQDNNETIRIAISLSDQTDWFYSMTIEERDNVTVISKCIKEWMSLKRKVNLFRYDIEYVAELITAITEGGVL